MKVMDPEQDKRTEFTNCLVKNLSAACSTPKLEGKLSASSAEPGNEAVKAGDSNAETSWKASAAQDQWLQIDFGKSIAVNEFKIKEDTASSVSRYSIEYWDAKTSRWASAFNGMHIKGEFVAPIVGRNTSKVRIVFMGSTDDSVPGIREFEAYYDISGETFNDPKGEAARHKVGG